MKKVLVIALIALINVETKAQQIQINRPIRFLALGDSYTIGESVSTAERWPNQLAENLKNTGFELDELKIIARTGWTTNDLLNALERENPSTDYNLVSLLIGVNNQYRGTSFSIYPTEFLQLLNKAIAYCGGKTSGVFVVSIPDYGYTPFGASNRATISREIDNYNETNQRIANDLGVTYINITPISREADEKPQYIAYDNLHPSGIMYAEWVKKVIQSIDFNSEPETSVGSKKFEWKLYPNPAISQISCTSEKPIDSITLYNLLGNQVMQKNTQGYKQFKLDVSTLQSGVYFYEVSTIDHIRTSGKLVIR